jgi:transposase-like protein
MQAKKLQVIFEVEVQSEMGEWGVEDVLRELEGRGLSVVSHQVLDGEERASLAWRPLAPGAEICTARRGPSLECL